MVTLWLQIAWAGTSALYGADGELWDPRGRLPDFSYAGYHAGERAIPDVPVVTNVRDHGAVGDGVADDTAAFRSALAVGEGAVLVPEGTWRLTDVLRVERSGVVLRGEGPGTVLAFERSLADIFGPRSEWSWEGGLLWFAGRGAGADLAGVADASRGDTTLTVTDATGIAAGDLVLLRLVDDGSGSLGRHLHADQEDSGSCPYQEPYGFDWPVRVAAVDGSTVTLAQPLRTDVRAEWAPRLHATDPVSEVGVESLVVRFPDVPYAGHLREPGYNGVFFTAGVADAWVRDVTFENADNGVLTAWWTKGVEARGIAFEGREGHHGTNISYAADGLFADLAFGDTTFVHELTVDHRTNGTVYKQVTADQPVALDHHRDGPFENLFTDFRVATTWVSGGSTCAGSFSGARGTYWGLPGPVPPPVWGHVQANLVGELTVADDMTATAQWYENVADLVPRDLHEAQRRNRLGLPDPDTGVDDADAGACGCSGTPASVASVLALLAAFAWRAR